MTPVGGRLAEVRVGDRTYSAVVDRASAELDQRTRFARIYLILEGAADLRPGTFVDVTVLGRAEEVARERREALARAGRAARLGQLSGAIGHGLR